MTGVFLTLTTGTAGYLVFKRFNFPVPAILGSLFFVSALNLAGFFPQFPLYYISWFSNVVIGCYVGQRVTRSSVGIIKDLPLPALIVSAGMIALSLTGGVGLYFFSELSLKTAFLGSTAGGIAEMALLSMALGADVPTVTLLQVFRLLAAILATPFICRRWTRWHENRARPKFPSPSPLPMEKPSLRDDDEIPPIPPLPPSRNWTGLAILAVTALAGAFTGYTLRLPVGILTGAMFAVSATNLGWKEQPPMPPVLRTMAQIGIGIIIASNITLDTLVQFASMALPIIALTAIMLFLSVLLGFLLHKMTGWNYPTCLLSTSLGGLSQMTIISEEMGADPLKVSILQTVRLVSILLVLPFLFNYLFA